ncbi:unnamed protein product, partial [Laminaria digitata]
MGEAGYRDTSGNWLARPSRPFESYCKARRFSKEELEEEGEETETPGGAASEICGASDDSGAGSGASVLFVRESKLIQ